MKEGSIENLNSRRKKVRSVFKAAFIGGLIFGCLTLAVVVGDHFWGSGTSGEPGPDTFLFLDMIIGTPTAIVTNGTGVEQWLLHLHSTTLADFLTYSLFAVINGLLGALIVAVPTAFWQFIQKGDKKN